jgi:hypothetical protein
MMTPGFPGHHNRNEGFGFKYMSLSIIVFSVIPIKKKPSFGIVI